MTSVRIWTATAQRCSSTASNPSQAAATRAGERRLALPSAVPGKPAQPVEVARRGQRNRGVESHEGGLRSVEQGRVHRPDHLRDGRRRALPRKRLFRRAVHAGAHRSVPAGRRDPPTPQQGAGIHEGSHPGHGRRGELGVVAPPYGLGVTQGELVQGGVPGEVRAMAGRSPALGNPVVEPDQAVIVLPGLVQRVGERVDRMSRRRFARQGALGEQHGLVVPGLVLTHEGEKGDVPPMIAVGGRQPLHEPPDLLPHLGHPREGDRRNGGGDRPTWSATAPSASPRVSSR